MAVTHHVITNWAFIHCYGDRTQTKTNFLNYQGLEGLIYSQMEGPGEVRLNGATMRSAYAAALARAIV